MINIQQPSNMPPQHSFSAGPRADITRSRFNRTRVINTAFDSGYLVPIFWDDLLPGDTISIKPQIFARLSNPLSQAPVTGLHFDTFWFKCPQRLLWKITSDESGSWERFNGEQDLDPEQSTAFTMPLIMIPDVGFAPGSIFDYFGLPISVGNDVAQEEITADLLRAYNLIYDTWFRDQNLAPAVPYNYGDGPDDPTDYVLLRRFKRHDYFTSCLPWPQKGDAVILPIGVSAPIDMIGTGNIPVTGALNSLAMEYLTPAGTFANMDISAADVLSVTGGGAMGSGTAEAQLNSGGVTSNLDDTDITALAARLQVDLAAATPVTINALIEAFQMQGVFVRDAQGGTRYIEQLLAHWGVVADNASLQRPELIFVTTDSMNVHPIANTAAASGGRPQGALGSYATSFIRGSGRTSATEHCVVIGIAEVWADLLYHQGIERRWSRRTRFDFPLPALMHLGEQAVLNKEIYLSNEIPDQPAGNNGVFGYIPRNDDFRFAQSRLTGPMRPSAAGTGFGDLWTMAQWFTALPILDDPAFINDNPPIARASVTTFTPQILVDGFVIVDHVRPMPTMAVPPTLSRF